MTSTGVSGYPSLRPTGLCADEKRTLTPGEAMVSVLIERPDSDRLERLDYSLAAWERGVRPEATVVGSWRTAMGQVESKQTLRLGPDELLDLFEQIADAPQDSRRTFRYVLALLLIRKRLLRYEGSRVVDGRKVMLVRIARADKSAPPVEVPDPNLDDAAINDAIEQMSEIIPVETVTPGDAA